MNFTLASGVRQIRCAVIAFNHITFSEARITSGPFLAYASAAAHHLQHQPRISAYMHSSKWSSRQSTIPPLPLIGRGLRLTLDLDGAEPSLA